MKVWISRIGLTLAIVLTGLVATVLMRALLWRSSQVAAETISPLDIDDGALARLAAAVRVPTVSVAEAADADFSEFARLREVLETSFPQVHRKLVRELIGGQSLLFTWPGREPSAKGVLLMGHMDVVPVEPGTESGWTHAPSQAT